MKYLKWKKEIRRYFKIIKKEYGLNGVSLCMPKEKLRGAVFNLSTNTVFLSFEHANKEYTKYNKRYSLIDISIVIICHELGHYFQKKSGVEKGSFRDYRHIVGLLIKGIDKEKKLEPKERLEILREYKTLILQFENDAWELGRRVFSGEDSMYQVIQTQSVGTYMKGASRYIGRCLYEIRKSEEYSGVS